MNLKLVGIIGLLAFSCSEDSETISRNNVSSALTDSKPSTAANARTEEYSFNGDEGDPLGYEAAKQWVQNYRAKNPDQTRAHFFGREIINQLLSEEGCVGVRIYYALDDSGQKQLLLVGVDSKGQDLLPTEGGRISGEGNIIADYSRPCPTECSGVGGLN